MTDIETAIMIKNMARETVKRMTATAKNSVLPQLNRAYDERDKLREKIKKAETSRDTSLYSRLVAELTKKDEEVKRLEQIYQKELK